MSVRPPSVVIRVLAWLERGLPAALLANHETRRRALLIVGTIWVMILACVFTIPVLLATTHGLTRIAASMVNLGTIGVSFAALKLLKRRGTRAAGHTVTAIAYVGMIWVVTISGGLTSPYWVLLVSVPAVLGSPAVVSVSLVAGLVVVLLSVLLSLAIVAVPVVTAVVASV